ncbi:MAG: thiamine phosphate synthase [Prevotella sp.]|jgi:hydroxymethylpyrimidine kinase/thiamin-phosphate pyrophosphorylase|uniref:thiamine phosphate synthase n=1 Tax=Prevotella sp. TaxID=59823 RepID=UPI001CAF0272|nr:thiamine phosphate synthase [Prevotella sp.]MBF1613452.1 thiamine phosphate synthase [Prevotella sp.]
MKWITITSPEFLSGEATFISKLFLQGLDLLHLRKPEASLEAYKQLLLQIPEQWHSRIVLHEHFELAEEYKLHGIHLNRRCSVVPNAYHGSISCSCHTIEEVITQKDSKNYVFLSPIFDSISKVGYHAAFSPTSLKQAAVENVIDEKVIALGGITANNIPLVKEWHFGGVALLGDIWKRMSDPQVDEYLNHIRTLL